MHNQVHEEDGYEGEISPETMALAYQELDNQEEFLPEDELLEEQEPSFLLDHHYIMELMPVEEHSIATDILQDIIHDKMMEASTLPEEIMEEMDPPTANRIFQHHLEEISKTSKENLLQAVKSDPATPAFPESTISSIIDRTIAKDNQVTISQALTAPAKGRQAQDNRWMKIKASADHMKEHLAPPSLDSDLFLAPDLIEGHDALGVPKPRYKPKPVQEPTATAEPTADRLEQPLQPSYQHPH